MASDLGEFKKPPLKRGLKKPPGFGGPSSTDDNGGSGIDLNSSTTVNSSGPGVGAVPPKLGMLTSTLLTAGSTSNFSPRDAKHAFNTPASLILPGIYLGSQANAASSKQLALLGATRILDLKERFVAGESSVPNMIVHAVPMSDHGDTSIAEILTECIDFIQRARNEKNTILVHCRGGVNRSATVIMAYLMKAESMTLKEAFDHVRKCRPAVSPVPEYLKQLQEYEITIFGKSTLDLEAANNNNMSLTQRISEWREAKRKNGSMPADMTSSRSGSLDESDSATRAHTAPTMTSSPGHLRVTNAPSASGSASTTQSDLSGSVEETSPLTPK